MKATTRYALVVSCSMLVAGAGGCASQTSLRPSMNSVTRWIPRISWPRQEEGSSSSLAKKSSRSLSLELARGRNLEKSGKLDEARNVYQRLLAEHPERAEVYHRLGVVADLQRRHSEAQQLFTQAIQRSPREALYFNDLGYCFFLQGDLSKAESALAKSVRLEPGNSRFHNNLGMVLGHQKRFEEAFAQFSKAGGEADAYYNMAFIHAALDQAGAAKQAFLQALASDPTHEKSREALQNFEAFDKHPEGRDQLAADGGVRWVPYQESDSGKQVSQATATIADNRNAGAATRAQHKGTQSLFNRNMRSQRDADESDGAATP